MTWKVASEVTAPTVWRADATARNDSSQHTSDTSGWRWATVAPTTPVPHPRSTTTAPGSGAGRWSSRRRVPGSMLLAENTPGRPVTSRPSGVTHRRGPGPGPGSSDGSTEASSRRAFLRAREVGVGPMACSKAAMVDRCTALVMPAPTTTEPACRSGRRRWSSSSSTASVRGTFTTTTSTGPAGSEVLGTKVTADGSRPLRSRLARVAATVTIESVHDVGPWVARAVASAPCASSTTSHRSPAAPTSARWARASSSAASHARSGSPGSWWARSRVNVPWDTVRM